MSPKKKIPAKRSTRNGKQNGKRETVPLATIPDPEKSTLPLEKHPGGRPSKFTPQATRRILKSIRLGSPLNLACKGAGVDYSTMRYWVTEGLQLGEGGKFEFAEALEKAQGGFIDANLRIIRAAAKKTWQAAAWLLERTRPQEFSRSVVRVEGEIKKTDRTEQDITIRILSDEKASKYATLLAGKIARQRSVPSGDNGA